MSGIDIAEEYFNNGHFVLSIGALDEWIENHQIAHMLELKVHNLMELDNKEEALKTVQILNVVGEKYHYKMLHLHVLNMMGRYYEAHDLLQVVDQEYGVNIGLNRLFLKLIT